MRYEKITREKPEVDPSVLGESALFLLLLIVSAAFFGLLAFASGESANSDIEADMQAIGNTSVVSRKSVMEIELGKMVEGHPIEAMVPYISKENPETAKYLVSIAKHESNWGTYSPTDVNGNTCYNYWGYRGSGDNVTRSGYSCFESPKEAVAVVGSRLNYLIWDLRLDTPEELIVWKCGRSCAGHSASGVRSWINNVDFYARKVESARLADASVRP